jgi:hypothetical protein
MAKLQVIDHIPLGFMVLCKWCNRTSALEYVSLKREIIEQLQESHPVGSAFIHKCPKCQTGP